MRIGIDLLAERAGRSTGGETVAYNVVRCMQSLNNGKHTFYLFINERSVGLYGRLVDDFSKTVTIPISGEHRGARVVSQQVSLPYYIHRLALDSIYCPSAVIPLLHPKGTVLHVQSLHHFQISDEMKPVRRIYLTALGTWSARRAQAIVVSSLSTKEDTCRFYGVSPAKIFIVPLGVDHELYKPAMSGSTPYLETLTEYGVQRPFVLFVSALYRFKGAEETLRALKLAIDAHGFPHNLVFAGPDPTGQTEHLRAVASELGIADRVRILGHIADRTKIRDLYLAAEVLVYPSKYETFGLPPLEAMACGTPVIASNWTSVPEIVGDAGLIADPDNVPEMTNAISRVLVDSELRELLVHKGLAHAREFTWENTAALLLSVCEDAGLSSVHGLGSQIEQERPM